MTDDDIPAPGPLTAQQLRQAHQAKGAVWISIEAALEIAGTDNPASLFSALSSGAVQCRWQHPGRWWQLTPVPPRLWGVARISGTDLIGPNGTSLEGAHQVFRLNERHWREWLRQHDQAESTAEIEVAAPVVDVPASESVTRDANAEEIRDAMRAVYGETEEAPDVNKVIPLVRNRLEANGLCALWRTIKEVAREHEFRGRRNKRGRTRKTMSKLRTHCENS